MSGKKPREIAVHILEGRERGEFIESLLDRALAGAALSSADRGLCQELVYGIVRWQATLDWLIGRKTGDREQKPLLRTLLRLGLYQIFWLDRIPNHAAVHETVELAKSSGLRPQAGFVNAVLRGYLREFDATERMLAELKTSQPFLGYSHPEWLAARWQKRWGAEKAAQLMAWNNTAPKTFARVNTLKTEAGTLMAQWREETVEFEAVAHDWIGEDMMFELKAHPWLNGLASFQQGLFYVQDPSTLLAVRELDPRPGEAVLDLCAAPGGKLTYIGQLMRNEGRLVGHDTSPERLKLMEENCARLGVKCEVRGEKLEVRSEKAEAGSQKAEGRSEKAEVRSEKAEGGGQRAEGGDASELMLFDRVLVDAPCSNTGVMRRRVDLRWRIRREEIERLRAGQLELLAQAASVLKPGGTLVYSTCSLEAEENREVVDEFLSRHANFGLERSRELLPFVEGVDGAYVARMRFNPP